MIIDFEKIAEAHIEGFKGGEGKLTRATTSMTAPASCTPRFARRRSGEHRHESTFEVIYVLSGELTFCYDGQEEVCRVGQAHYCPEGHTHAFENRTDHDALYLAIVPTLG